MYRRRRGKRLIDILLGIIFFTALVIGVSLGLLFGLTMNEDDLLEIIENPDETGSQVLDVKGRVITELFREIKRDIVPLEEIPQCLVHALLTKEDREFYQHNGFSLWNILRAAWYIITGQYFSGSSTLTQQVAGRLFTDRSDISLTRKIIELWYAIQMERQLTKDEIMELYLNKMFFGHGCYSAEAASQYYFHHSVREITPAEAAMLVVQLSWPAGNSPINHPNRARKLQRDTLNEMVNLDYLTKEEADASFMAYEQKRYWMRDDLPPPYIKENKAPYFTVYVEQQLEEMLEGKIDIYRDGLKIYTTLNIDFQKVAEELMSEKIDSLNERYAKTIKSKSSTGEIFVPIVDLLSLSFNMPKIHVGTQRYLKDAMEYYNEELNPVLDVVSSIFGIEGGKFMAYEGYKKAEVNIKETQIQGALVSIDPNNGYILAMQGGREFEARNQVNYAISQSFHPGSAFKPLYYWYAIENDLLSPASILPDKPVSFTTLEGELYIPTNYSGEWKDRVNARYALAHSLNIPACHVLDMIGFDGTIEAASNILSMTDEEQIRRTFPRVWPLALGVVDLSPLQMAQAMATYPNKGRVVEPIAIRYIEDRNGRIIFEPEKALRARQKSDGDKLQIMSPQTAYIMTNMLQSTASWGTVSYMPSSRENLNELRSRGYSVAGKTGTTHNWHDAWTVGFTTHVVTAIWFGFDKGSGSLGTNSSGSQIAAPVWCKYMNAVHQDQMPEQFDRPQSGLVDVRICKDSGMLPSDSCPASSISVEIFKKGTEPTRFCTYHDFQNERFEETLVKIFSDTTLLSSIPPDDASSDDIDLFLLDMPGRLGIEETDFDDIMPPINFSTDEEEDIYSMNIHGDGFVVSENTIDEVGIVDISEEPIPQDSINATEDTTVESEIDFSLLE